MISIGVIYLLQLYSSILDYMWDMEALACDFLSCLVWKSWYQMSEVVDNLSMIRQESELIFVLSGFCILHGSSGKGSRSQGKNMDWIKGTILST